MRRALTRGILELLEERVAHSSVGGAIWDLGENLASAALRTRVGR
jgi:hypothetical protein